METSKKTPGKTSELTPRETRFCQEYILDYNATKAAIRAGYSEKSAGANAWKILRRPGIRRCIAALQQEQKERLCLNGDRIILELFDLLKKCKEPVPVRVWSRTEKRYVETGEYKFDSKGALKIVELLMKHLGMLGHDAENADDAPVWLMDDLDAEPCREDSGGKTGLDGKDGQP